jgi:Family of unknown function (DUF6325)
MRAPDQDDDDRPMVDAALSEPVLSDLVEYLVIQVPDLRSLSSVGPALTALTTASTIRILDLVAVTVDDLGGAHEVGLDEIDGLVDVAAFVHLRHELLSAHDVRLAALALPPGSAGLVLVTEDRWAASLDGAARSVGGRIVTGERIPAHRFELALAHAPALGDDGKHERAR